MKPNRKDFKEGKVDWGKARRVLGEKLASELKDISDLLRVRSRHARRHNKKTK